MAQKITNKNLHYDTTLPPFLARLHGQAGPSHADGPSPLLAGNRRHARPRTGSAEAEDAPLVVDEEGNVVADVQVGADGSVREKDGGGAEPEADGGDGAAAAGGDGGTKGEGAAARDAEKVAGIGGGRKRKVGKVVGATGADDAYGGEEEEDRGRASASSSKKSKPGGQGREPAVASGEGLKPGGAKGKKKAKKIKLSFGDDEEG